MKMFLLASSLAIATSVHAQSVDRFDPSEPVNTTLPSGQLARVPNAVLFDQGPITNGTDGTPPVPVSILTGAAPFNYNTLGFGATAAQRTADDFVVPAGQTWIVNSVTVYAYQTGSLTPTLNGATLRIWNTTPTVGGTPIFGDTTTNRFLSGGLQGGFRVADNALTGRTRPIQAAQIAVSPPLTLTAGTYWIDWNLAGSGASGPFAAPVVPTIAAPAPTGNAIQLNPAATATAWTPLNIGLVSDPAAGPLTGPQQGMPFIIEGTSGLPIAATRPSGPVSIAVSNGTGTASFGFTGGPGSVTCALSAATGTPFVLSPANGVVAVPGSLTVTTTGVGAATLTCSNGATVVATYGLSSTVSLAAPALSTWGLMALLATMLGLGVFAARRFS